MIHEFAFTIPGQPPSVNRMYGNTYRFDAEGGRYAGRRKLAEVEAYQFVAMNACQRAKPALWKPREPHSPKLGMGMIVIELYYFLKRDIDCDNTQKAILDAIKYGLGLEQHTSRKGRAALRPIYDDSRFLGRAMFKITGVKEPHVNVTVIG